MLETRRHFHNAISALKKKKPLVAYVGAASRDNLPFRKMISMALTGARVEPVKLAAARASVSAARQLLEDCDMVFVSGGDVELGMKILHERGVVGDLRRLHTQKKPFLAVSAGSIMLAPHWVRFESDDDEKAELFECLGVVDVHVDCHDEEGGWSELRALLQLLPEGTVGYGIPSRGCLRVDGGLAAQGVPLPRFKAHQQSAVEDGALAP
jgi:peptidase E